jgi:hypothetical protein
MLRVKTMKRMIVKKKNFEIVNCAGIIEKKFRAEDLGKFVGEVKVDIKRTTTLRAAAIEFNNNTKIAKIVESKAKKATGGYGEL